VESVTVTRSKEVSIEVALSVAEAFTAHEPVPRVSENSTENEMPGMDEALWRMKVIWSLESGAGRRETKGRPAKPAGGRVEALGVARVGA